MERESYWEIRYIDRSGEGRSMKLYRTERDDAFLRRLGLLPTLCELVNRPYPALDTDDKLNLEVPNETQ